MLFEYGKSIRQKSRLAPHRRIFHVDQSDPAAADDTLDLCLRFAVIQADACAAELRSIGILDEDGNLMTAGGLNAGGGRTFSPLEANSWPPRRARLFRTPAP